MHGQSADPSRLSILFFVVALFALPAVASFLVR
jgi:hypothetical protein